jgi:hypothetical protein
MIKVLKRQAFHKKRHRWVRWVLIKDDHLLIPVVSVSVPYFKVVAEVYLTRSALLLPCNHSCRHSVLSHGDEDKRNGIQVNLYFQSTRTQIQCELALYRNSSGVLALPKSIFRLFLEFLHVTSNHFLLTYGVFWFVFCSKTRCTSSKNIPFLCKKVQK